jgi:hypothetical protein
MTPRPNRPACLQAFGGNLQGLAAVARNGRWGKAIQVPGPGS